ncbi:MAG: hypothetical protein ABMA02_20210, partial [Saprospiraceae bacterium]
RPALALAGVHRLPWPAWLGLAIGGVLLAAAVADAPSVAWADGLPDGVRSLADLYFVSNKIYAPSYISLESALAHYGWIPEGVFLVMAITTLKTANFDTIAGHFQYASVKPSLFFGYKILTENGRGIKMAEPEKALLDFLYFHPELREPEDFEAFRLNLFQMKSDLDLQKTQDYASLFGSKALGTRLLTFQKLLNDAESY